MPERITRFTRNALVFDVRDEGPISGTPVVLLHGFPQDSHSWDAVVPALHTAGFRTLAPNQRGYSPGARPRRRRDYRGEELAADIAALIAAVDAGPVHLVGHDWGAAAAWQVAAGYPDLIRTLTAVSVPHPAAMVRAIRTSRQAFRSWYMLAFQVPWIPELLLTKPALTRGILERMGQTPQRAARDQSNLADRTAARGAVHWYRGLPFTDRHATSRPVRVPTLLVWSDRDKAIGPEGPELTERYVRAPYRLVTLPGVSHWIPDEAPEELAELILDHASTPG